MSNWNLKWIWTGLLVIVLGGLSGCHSLEPDDDFSASLSVDTCSSSDEWNAVWKSDILEPGRYYEASIPYRISELEPNAYLYSVVVPDDDPAGTLASVRWRSDHLKTQTLTFFLPEDAVDCRVVIGMRNHGKAALGDVSIQELPPMDLSAVKTVSEPDYEPYGMCTHFTRWTIWGPEAGFTDEQVKESLRRLGEAGVQWIRVDAFWVIVEEKEGIYDEILLTRIDNIISWAAENGIKVYLHLGGQPQWASTHPDEPDYWAYGTDRIAEFKDYVRYVTQRYKGRVQYWEVGNEVDWVFWKDPLADYVDYLKTASDIIRNADPENQVILASLAFDGTHVWEPQAGAEEDALRRLYEMGIQPCFDVMGMHFYPLQQHNGLYESVSAINQVVKVMEEFSDGDKPIWLTESGYSSEKTPDGDLVKQADYLNLLYTEIIAHPKVEKIFWYNFRCKHDEGEYENNFGVVNNDFSERPAFSVFKKLEKVRLRPVNRTFLPECSK